ncbi:hypothetical protein DID77_03445 [Candidatus Marinamargulisbacteria bacterium SCGC AG-439-L15]|nr:hypothetical protein DID77_03445 [Candidatus Marinamargulisbacteria bacterium SCGC AG-439-L15]
MIEKTAKFLYACICWPIFVVLLALFLVWAVIISFFTIDSEYFLQQSSVPILKLIIGFYGVKIQTQGVELIPTDKPFLLTANHQSIMDIILILITVKPPFRFIAKKELALVPLLGWIMYVMGHYFIDRKNAAQAYAKLEAVKAQLLNGWSLAIFPEGTRSKTGKIGPFKRGSFKLALETGVPIVPCYIHGVHDILPKKALVPSSGTMYISFGKPIRVQKTVFKDKPDEISQCSTLAETTKSAVETLQKKYIN